MTHFEAINDIIRRYHDEAIYFAKKGDLKMKKSLKELCECGRLVY